MEENGSEKENIETDMLNTSENSNLDEVIDDTGVRITKVVPGNMNGSSCTFWRKKNMHFKSRVYFGVIREGINFAFSKICSYVLFIFNKFNKIFSDKNISCLFCRIS